jgi:hypothetical protein
MLEAIGKLVLTLIGILALGVIALSIVGVIIFMIGVTLYFLWRWKNDEPINFKKYSKQSAKEHPWGKL